LRNEGVAAARTLSPRDEGVAAARGRRGGSNVSPRGKGVAAARTLSPRGEGVDSNVLPARRAREEHDGRRPQRDDDEAEGAVAAHLEQLLRRRRAAEAHADGGGGGGDGALLVDFDFHLLEDLVDPQRDVAHVGEFRVALERAPRPKVLHDRRELGGGLGGEARQPDRALLLREPEKRVDGGRDVDARERVGRGLVGGEHDERREVALAAPFVLVRH